MAAIYTGPMISGVGAPPERRRRSGGFISPSRKAAWREGRRERKIERRVPGLERAGLDPAKWEEEFWKKREEKRGFKATEELHAREEMWRRRRLADAREHERRTRILTLAEEHETYQKERRDELADRKVDELEKRMKEERTQRAVLERTIGKEEFALREQMAKDRVEEAQRAQDQARELDQISARAKARPERLPFATGSRARAELTTLDHEVDRLQKRVDTLQDDADGYLAGADKIVPGDVAAKLARAREELTAARIERVTFIHGEEAPTGPTGAGFGGSVAAGGMVERPLGATPAPTGMIPRGPTHPQFGGGGPARGASAGYGGLGPRQVVTPTLRPGPAAAAEAMVGPPGRAMPTEEDERYKGAPHYSKTFRTRTFGSDAALQQALRVQGAAERLRGKGITSEMLAPAIMAALRREGFSDLEIEQIRSAL